MRQLIRVAMMLLMAVVLAAPATVSAQQYDGVRAAKARKGAKLRKPPGRPPGGHAAQEADRNRSDYYQHWADKLPFGSSRWFEQMEREGRFGGTDRCC